MNRYIDANALAYMVINNGDADFINKVTKLMIEAPSINIVFCKDCKRSKWCHNNGEFYLWCRPNIKRVKENGFCNCGADMRNKDNDQ